VRLGVCGCQHAKPQAERQKPWKQCFIAHKGELNMAKQTPCIDLSAHTPGTPKGEERVIREGREPGRRHPKGGRNARDSTSINPEARDPIDPRMPNLPPA
jgi:hypothetical protein